MGLKRNIKRIRRKYFPSDFELMLEKWKAEGDDYTLRFDYDLDVDSLVLDLGGYRGQWTSDLYSRYCCRILVFEPVSSFYEKIKDRFKFNDDIEVYQHGLGGISCKAVIHICADGSSIFKSGQSSEEIEIIDIKEWFENMNIREVDLVKINIEGGEYELLERMIETGIIKMIDSLQVQFHEISVDSDRRMKKIQQDLEETHFPTYQYKFVWENWKRNNS